MATSGGYTGSTGGSRTPQGTTQPSSKPLSYQEIYAILRYVGASPQEALILTAISKGESGHNPMAYNPRPPDNSYGLFQINMIGNMGPERRRWFGIKDNKELFNPGTNAVAALKILRSQGLKAWSVYSSGKYKQFMPQAQAAADFMESGGKVAMPANLDQIPGAGGGGGGGSAPGVAPPPMLRSNATEAEPELRKALLDAAHQGLVDTRFEELISRTKWWKSRTEAMRQWDMLQMQDPKEIQDRINKRLAVLKPMWEQYGLDGDINAMALNMERLGMNEAQLQMAIADQLTKESAATGLDQGTTGSTSTDQLLRIARMEYLTPVDRNTAERWVIKGIRTGEDIEESWRAYLSQLAAPRFGIDPVSGVAPGDLMAPIRMSVAQNLEIDPDTIDLLDPQYEALLQVETDKGGFRPMTANEATKWARSQEAFKGTHTAEDATSKLADALGKAFGRVG
jgi:hypothetical protein